MILRDNKISFKVEYARVGFLTKKLVTTFNHGVFKVLPHKWKDNLFKS